MEVTIYRYRVIKGKIEKGTLVESFENTLGMHPNMPVSVYCDEFDAVMFAGELEYVSQQTITISEEDLKKTGIMMGE